MPWIYRNLNVGTKHWMDCRFYDVAREMRERGLLAQAISREACEMKADLAKTYKGRHYELRWQPSQNWRNAKSGLRCDA